MNIRSLIEMVNDPRDPLHEGARVAARILAALQRGSIDPEWETVRGLRLLADATEASLEFHGVPKP